MYTKLLIVTFFIIKKVLKQFEHTLLKERLNQLLNIHAV